MTEEHKSRYELFLEEEARKALPTKRCSKCKKVKVVGEFYKDKSRALGVSSRCKECKCKSRRKYRNEEDRFWKRFWSKVVRVGTCLEWQGVSSGREPQCTWNGHPRTSLRRVVYRLSVGELHDDKLVTMTCDNRRCVRQSHMKQITKEEHFIRLHNNVPTGDRNGARTKPESYPRGECHYAAKLTESDVRTIRLEYAQGETTAAISRRWKVTRKSVYSITHGKTWKHVQSARNYQRCE